MRELLCEQCQKKISDKIQYKGYVDRKKRAYVTLTRLQRDLKDIQAVLEKDILKR